MGVWEVIWSLWLRHLGASMAFVGYTWVAFSVPMLFSFLGGWLADRYNRWVLMFSGYLVSAVAWITYGTTRNLTLFLVVSVIEGFAMAWSYPAKSAFLVQVVPSRWLGSVQGLESTFVQVAGLTGTLVAPLLYSHLSGYVIASPAASRSWVWCSPGRYCSRSGAVCRESETAVQEFDSVRKQR